MEMNNMDRDKMDDVSACRVVRGRYAPSPTGRMHLGNVFAALMSWLSVRSSGGQWILRIEDLDRQRSKIEYAQQIEDDLHWLGLDWDEGGLDDKGCSGPYRQALRDEIYLAFFNRLKETGWTYPCVCKRADILATQAPHQSDGRIVYSGRCRPSSLPLKPMADNCSEPHSERLFVPDRVVEFVDKVYGLQRVNLAEECGDFVVRRTDGAWAYQFAVVVDDALMGVSEVVRGNDLLLSTAEQLYLYELLGCEPPEFAHVPLICNDRGLRLSKRDSSMDMGELRKRYGAEEIVGYLAYLGGLLPYPDRCRPSDLTGLFGWNKIVKADNLVASEELYGDFLDIK